MSSWLVGRPPRISSRNGPTSSSDAGPPPPSTGRQSACDRRPSLVSSSDSTRFVDEVHEASEVLLLGLRQDAVSQVEHMARAPRGAAQNVRRRGPPDLGTADEGRRIQIPLDPVFRSDPLPRGVDRNAPVDPDQVSSRRGERLQEIGRAGPKVNEWDAGLSDLIEEFPAVWEYVRLVALLPNGPRPAVEDLNRLNAGLDLLP